MSRNPGFVVSNPNRKEAVWPVIIEANYSKKIGLPAYSSHSFSISTKLEVADLSQVERESSKLYHLLQSSVDREMQEEGYVPGPTSNGLASPRTPNGHAGQPNGDNWSCSDKQHELILRIKDEHKLDQEDIEVISKQLFQRPAKTLNKLEASVLIKELLEEYGPKQATGNDRPYQRGNRR